MKYKYLIDSDEEMWGLLESEELISNPAFHGIDKRLFITSVKDSLGLTKNQVNDIEYKFDKIEIEDCFIEEIYHLTNVSNRYLMIRSLIKVSEEKKIDFGIFGLLLYLGLTCFDSLGHKGKYKTFHQWLIKRNNKYVAELDEDIKQNCEKRLKDGLDSLFFKNYNPEFGVKNSFYNFLDLLKIKYKYSYDNFFGSIEVPIYYSKLLKIKSETENYKRDCLFSFRNDFTHNSRNLRWYVDNDLFYWHANIDSYQFLIAARPSALINSLLGCIEDGIKIKLNELKLFS